MFAETPLSPGYPEDVVVQGSRVYVTQPAAFNTAGLGPSPVYVYNKNTQLLDETILVAGEDLTQEHALSGAAIDSEDRLLVLSTQLGVLRFTKVGSSWTQENLSGPFQPLIPYLPSIPNGVAVMYDDSLLVTDSIQNVIWRVPADGGTPTLWFSDPSIVFSAQMGLNALKMNPTQDYVYIADTERDRIVRLPISDLDPKVPADLEVVYTFTPGSFPDGVVFDSDGDLWVVLAANAIVKLDVNTCGGFVEEEFRITDPEFQQPSNMYFVGGRKAYVVNHALFATTFDPNPFKVFEVYVGENGLELPY